MNMRVPVPAERSEPSTNGTANSARIRSPRARAMRDQKANTYSRVSSVFAWK